MGATLRGCLTFLLLLGACSGSSSSPPKPPEGPVIPKVVVERERIEKKEPPPEVKIRLKRDGKDNYSWELSGSDVDEILKTNGKLRKQLGGELPRKDPVEGR